MDLGNGWGLNETLLRKLRLLEYFADNSRGSSVPPLPEWAREPGTKEHADAISDLEDFDSNGWLRNFGQDYGGGANAQVVGPGYAYVEEIREKRENRTLRAKAARDALLHWLREVQFDTDQVPDLYAVLDTKFGRFYGETFTQREIDAASRYLYEQGYIIGPTVDESPAILRPTIQAKGIEAVDSNLSVNDRHAIPTPSIITTTTNITGDSNVVQAGSPGASQKVTLTTGQRDDVARLIAGLRELASTVPEAQSAADEVEQAAGGNDLGRLQRAFLTAQGAAMAAIGTDAGTQLVQLAHALMQAAH